MTNESLRALIWSPWIFNARCTMFDCKENQCHITAVPVYWLCLFSSSPERLPLFYRRISNFFATFPFGHNAMCSLLPAFQCFPSICLVNLDMYSGGLFIVWSVLTLVWQPLILQVSWLLHKSWTLATVSQVWGIFFSSSCRSRAQMWQFESPGDVRWTILIQFCTKDTFGFALSSLRMLKQL